MRVVFQPEIFIYFIDLAETLYEKEYFGSEETAIQYADDLFDDININLSTKFRKPAPPYFERYGENLYYSIFKRNKNTSWYVFFTIYQVNADEIIYYVRHISNNHMISQHL